MVTTSASEPAVSATRSASDASSDGSLDSFEPCSFEDPCSVRTWVARFTKDSLGPRANRPGAARWNTRPRTPRGHRKPALWPHPDSNLRRRDSEPRVCFPATRNRPAARPVFFFLAPSSPPSRRSRGDVERRDAGFGPRPQFARRVLARGGDRTANLRVPGVLLVLRPVRAVLQRASSSACTPTTHARGSIRRSRPLPPALLTTPATPTHAPGPKQERHERPGDVRRVLAQARSAK